MKFFYTILFFSVFLYANEPSAFSAGDLSADAPYGLTPMEKEIYDNKQDIRDMKARLFGVESGVKELQVNIECIRSVFEVEMGKLSKSKTQGEDIGTQSGSVDERLSSIENAIKEQNANINKINTILKELSSVVDSINSRYVSKDELGTLKKNSDDKVKPATPAKTTDNFDKKDTFKLFDEGEAMFKKGSFTEAKKRFDFTAQNNYKPAASNYYLGEIAYKAKDYKNAVVYYKNSAQIYDKADYMPSLLLNLGLSLSKVGDKKNSELFLKNLVEAYPDSKEAVEAKKNLK